MQNLVAIVGRPNVGKSTLFNRLTQSRQAIVTNIEGTTRDRLYGKVNWNGEEFSLVDTGGWVINSDDVMEDEINKQVRIAIEEADVILFNRLYNVLLKSALPLDNDTILYLIIKSTNKSTIFDNKLISE